MSIISVRRPVPECLPRPVSKDDKIVFSECDLGLILSGNKTEHVTTEYYNIERYSNVNAFFEDSGIQLKLFITHKKGCLFYELTNNDAYRSGFNDILNFKQNLKNRFNCNKYTNLYVFGFKVVG